MAGDGGAAVGDEGGVELTTPQGCLPTWRAQRRFNDDRNPAGGSYVLASRDIRGIGMSFKITPEASSSMNKGPPALRRRRSVKPSAQPTLVRTQHPPPEFSHIYLRIRRRRIAGSPAKAAVLRTVAFPPFGRVDGWVCRKHPDRPTQKANHSTALCAADIVRSEQDPEFAGYTRDGS
jgi:hypothetical protein